VEIPVFAPKFVGYVKYANVPVRQSLPTFYFQLEVSEAIPPAK
jgi:hypothetical protein